MLNNVNLVEGVVSFTFQRAWLQRSFTLSSLPLRSFSGCNGSTISRFTRRSRTYLLVSSLGSQFSTEAWLPPNFTLSLADPEDVKPHMLPRVKGAGGKRCDMEAKRG
jgi:hypothetical protein